MIDQDFEIERRKFKGCPILGSVAQEARGSIFMTMSPLYPCGELCSIARSAIIKSKSTRQQETHRHKSKGGETQSYNYARTCAQFSALYPSIDSDFAMN